MAFIGKKNPTVLNIKLTSKGRELLSEGKLTFNYFALGDSEIDYNFNSLAQLNPFYNQILKPVDENPNIISFIPKTISGDPYNFISNVSSVPTIVQNNANSIGFFNITGNSVSFLTDGDHVKQPDVMIKVDNLTGGTLLELFKAPTYLANVNEPSVGDFMLVKWSNKYDITSGTTGYNIDLSNPKPILVYKIQSIISGSLFNDNLIVEVDRELPNFSGITGTTNVNVGAIIFYNYINFTGDTIYNDYSTNYENESVLAFLQNCQCPTITFPFWNLSIVYIDEIIGVQTDNKKFQKFSSNLYGGFVSYIQNQKPVFNKLGIIHYSNFSPSNTYGEELYVNTVDNNVPILDIPTIMWHKSSTNLMGVKLKAINTLKTLTGETKSLNISYYDLGDLDGNVVGKVFPSLKVFVIEDQELLFALSYKSNRSWTLPNYSVGTNDNIVIGCPTCSIDFDVTVTNPTSLISGNGSLYIDNIVNQITGSKLILDVSGLTSGQIYFDQIVANALIGNLSADTYSVTIHDLGALNCQGKTIVMSNPTSILSIYNTGTTQSGLDPDFELSIINPTTIRVYLNDIGTIYGTGYTQIVSYGATAPISYLTIGTYHEFNNLTFLNPYTIYVKDKYTGSTEFIITKDYVAAGNPLNSNFIVSNQMVDSGGTYVILTNYLTTINPSVNPIIGTIEFSAYESTSVPSSWEVLPIGDPNGTSKKIYITGTRNYTVSVRERYQTIEMYKFTKTTIIV
jgi:hypothetical protein